MSAEVKVLLVEEFEERAELRKLLGAAQLNVVGEAGFGTDAVSASTQFKPDVAVVALAEPVARPLKTIESLVLAAPNLIIVVVSSLGDREHLRKAMQAGARDYLVLPIRPNDLYKSVLKLVASEHQRATIERDGKGLQRGDVISVFGVKGGIGKTTLSVNLAAAIAAETKQRVGVIDLDLQLGDVAVALNFVPEHTIADAVDALDRLEPELLQSILYPDPSGLRVLPAPLQPEEADRIGPEQVQRILSVMSQTYDYVVVDTPPMFSDAVGAVLDASTMILLLTTQDLLSLRRTKVAIEMLHGWGYSEDKVKLVINYAYHVDGVMGRDIESTLEYPIFWKVPNDPIVPVSLKEGRPFVETHGNSKVGKNVVDLARIVCGAKKRSNGLLGLWSR